MNKKKKCERCNRLLRSSKLSENKVTKQLLCSRCNKQVGQNKFYTPKSQSFKRFQRITNFSITADEKNVLRKSKNNNQINSLCNSLKNVRKINKYRKFKEQEQKTNKEYEKTETKKKFIEGLK